MWVHSLVAKSDHYDTSTNILDYYTCEDYMTLSPHNDSHAQTHRAIIGLQVEGGLPIRSLSVVRHH